MITGEPPTENSAQRVFGPQARVYAESPVHVDDPSLDAMRDMVDMQCPDGYGWALDLGTGAGFTAFAMARFARRVLAIDPTLAMLREARRIGRERGLVNVALSRNLAEALPVAAGSAELVTSRMAAHHFPDFERMLDEVCRVLKSGGALVMADSIAPSDDSAAVWMNDIELRRDYSHIQDRQEQVIDNLLRRRGLTIVRKEHTRIGLHFNDWVARTATPQDEVESLRRDFLDAPEIVRQAFQISPDGDDIGFSWPCLIFLATKD